MTTLSCEVEKILYDFDFDKDLKNRIEKATVKVVALMSEKEEIIEIAEKYRKDHRDYKDKCDDNQTLRVLLGCQEMEIRNIRIHIQEFKNKSTQECARLRELLRSLFVILPDDFVMETKLLDEINVALIEEK